jgi:hypothetical protein
LQNHFIVDCFVSASAATATGDDNYNSIQVGLSINTAAAALDNDDEWF